MKVCALCFVLWAVVVGCGETVVDTAPIADVQRVAADVQGKVQGARDTFDAMKRQANDLQTNVEKVGKYTAEAKAFVDKGLASSDEKIQAATKPIMKAAVLKDPMARAIIFAQLRQKAQEGSKKAGEMLKDLESLVKTRVGGQ